MTLSLVHDGGANTTGASVTATGITIGAGNCIVVVTHEATNNSAGTVTDSAGNFYSLAVQETYNSGCIAIFYCPNCLALSGGSVTYTPISSVTVGLDVNHAAGVATTSPVANTSKAQTGPLTLAPGASGCLFVAVAGQASSGPLTQDTADGWASPPNVIFSGFDISGSQSISGSGTQSWSPGGQVPTTAFIMAAFKPAGGGGGTETGTAALALSGVSFNVAGSKFHEDGQVALALGGVNFKINAVDVTAEPTLVNFYTF